jgi:deoxyribodipyrimidine photo-lyase
VVERSILPTSKPLIVLVRRDLRLEDNRVLLYAQDQQIIPLYVLDTEDPYPPGGASKWWLLRSLKSMGEALEERGAPLILRHGPYAATVADFAQSIGVQAVFWHQGSTPYELQQDSALTAQCEDRHIAYKLFPRDSLAPWEEILTRQGTPYRLFLPFWRQLRAQLAPIPNNPAPDTLRGFGVIPGDRLESWSLQPAPVNWTSAFPKLWVPGEAGAQAKWQHFLIEGLSSYHNNRDSLSEQGTSQLSAHLHHGEISVSRIARDILGQQNPGEKSNLAADGAENYLRELAWRDFSAYTLCHSPAMANGPADPSFAALPGRPPPQWREAGGAGGGRDSGVF